MKQSIVHLALVVDDYDEAIAFYTQMLDFELIEDTYQLEQDKRWVVVSPKGSQGTTILLAKASKPIQEKFVGDQAGDGSFYFSVPMIFNGITTKCWKKGSYSLEIRKLRRMARWRYLRICTGICGT